MSAIAPAETPVSYLHHHSIGFTTVISCNVPAAVTLTSACQLTIQAQARALSSYASIVTGPCDLLGDVRQ